MRKIVFLRFQFRALLCLFTVLISGIFALNSCVKMNRQPLEKRYYNLEVSRTQELNEPLLNAILRVQRLQISPRFSGREIVYKTGDSIYEADFYNLFFITPSDMLTQDLREWMQESKLFSNAVDPSSLVRTSFSLEGIVNEFYGDFTKENGEAVVKMQFFLIDDTYAVKKLIFSGSYKKYVSIDNKSAISLIKGFNQAVTDVFIQLEADLRKQAEEIVKTHAHN
ncbi:MAG TPA: hypothetical protein PK874_08295 [Desulfobacteraceae bacterium]|nr:hypothetical protein [Desulfobacteraceae bacterium]HPJ68544.1 hypothetical protein [Desulfobacteraceae bacterium]HPQ28698.1 hypothetical protein [Desulfobacteraceae bacterium]